MRDNTKKEKASLLIFYFFFLRSTLAICSSGFEIGFSSGPAITFDFHGAMEESYFVAIPLVGKIGYKFSSLPLAVAVEFNYAFSTEGKNSIDGHMLIASAIGNFYFFEETSLRSFVIIGAGWGWAAFTSADGESSSGSGLGQLQLGVGLSYSLTEWLEIFTESRFRFGFPSHSQVITYIQQFGFIFRPL